MNLVPSRGKTGEPGSPDAKFRCMRIYKKNQRSAQSRENRKCKRKYHRSAARANHKFLKSSLCGQSPAEIKSKLKDSRSVRKSGAFKHNKTPSFISVDEKSAATADGIAQRGLIRGDSRKRIFFNARNSTFIGTYNARTLTAKWRRHELVCYSVKNGIEVFAIQEHRIVFKSDDPIRKEHYGNQWVFLYTTADEKGGGGVGFLVSARVYKFVTSVKSISPRILQLKIKDHAKIASCFYCIYSPTSCAELEVVEDFYSALSGSVEIIPAAIILFILGDFNAMLQKGEASVRFSPNVAENQNSSLLVDFIQSNGLVAANTLFCKKSQFSFYGPKGRKVLLDYVLIRKKWCKSVSDCEIRCVSTVASDHNLKKVKVKWVLKNYKNGLKKSRKVLSYLKDPECTKAVTNFVLKDYNSNCTQDNQHNYSLFSRLAKEAVGKFVPDMEKVEKRKPWEDQEIIKARGVLQKTKLEYQSCKNPENKAAAIACAKTLSDLYILKENQYYDSLSEDLINLSGDHQYTAAWKQINIITGRKARTQYAINADSKEEETKLWVAHFKQLLSPGVTPSVKKVVHPNVFPGIKLDYNVELFTLNELQSATKSMSDGKAAGVDELINEILKLEEFHPLLLSIINQAYVTKTVPQEWLISLLIPVFKKGDSTDPNNYRGIALMCVCAKLYNRMLLERIRSVLDKHLRSNQNGFRQLRSTAQHVLAVRRIFESVRMTKDAKLVAIFVDFCKAFDSVNWVQIEAILYAYQVPEELVQAIMSIYNGAKAGLRDSEGQVYDENTFNLSVGVLQGDTLAPYIFIIVMDFVLRIAMVDTCGILIKKKTGTVRRPLTPAMYITDLDFADDIVLFGSSISNAQKLINNLEKAALKVGLKMNEKETEYILVGDWGKRKQKNIKVSSGKLKRVEDYKYLGSWLLNSSTDFRIRKDLAWTAIKKLYRVWRSHVIKREIKIKLFMATIESILLYNATTWTMTQSLEKSLDGAYTKLLRYALNVSWRDHVKNDVLYGNLPRISIRLRERRMVFAGHCWRCKYSAMQPIHELLFWSVPGGVQKPGNWTTYVKVLLEDFGSGKVKKKDLAGAEVLIQSAMEDRKEWKKIVKRVCK